MIRFFTVLVCLLFLQSTAFTFVPSHLRTFSASNVICDSNFQRLQKDLRNPSKYLISASTSLNMGFMDDISKLFKAFTQKASASHILIKGGAEAEDKLNEIKADIGVS